MRSQLLPPGIEPAWNSLERQPRVNSALKRNRGRGTIREVAGREHNPLLRIRAFCHQGETKWGFSTRQTRGPRPEASLGPRY
jgi:hypothetical protein